MVAAANSTISGPLAVAFHVDHHQVLPGQSGA